MMARVGVLLLALAVSLAFGGISRAESYEVWTVDQANVQNDGDRLMIYTPGSWTQPRETIYLWEKATGVGDGPGTRPHLLVFNSRYSHGILANVATGHVYVIRAADRAMVASIDVGDQAHGAVASPDDKWILAANQNGKRLARIQADFGTESYTYDPLADLDLKALEDEAHPDNAPICPLMFVGASKAYVTMRGGGMYVVDTAATPMQVVKQFTKDQVAAAGCGGLVVGDKVYVNSGTATSSNLYIFDAATDELTQTLPMSQHGTDAHGMVLVGGRYLWMAHRGDGDNIVIIDTQTQQMVGTITDVGAGPDLMDISPAGDLVFVTLRGPKALTGGPSAMGQTPGVAVLLVDQGGATGRRVAFAPIGPQIPESNADPHAIAVRPVR